MLVQPISITKPKIPPDPAPVPATSLIAAADRVLPITRDDTYPETGPYTDPLTTNHVPVSPMHEKETLDHPEEQSAQAGDYLQNLINQGFQYEQSIEAFTFYTDSEEEEEEDQSIPTMEEPKWRSQPKDSHN